MTTCYELISERTLRGKVFENVFIPKKMSPALLSYYTNHYHYEHIHLYKYIFYFSMLSLS